jgi:hypothetical protein
MGMRREPSTTTRKPTGHREVASGDGEQRGCRTTFRRLLGVDRQRLYRVSGIQAPSWCAMRIQPHVYVRSDGFAWRIVRYASESRARDLSQFFSPGDAVAVQRNPSGNLKGFCITTYSPAIELERRLGCRRETVIATENCQCWISVTNLSAVTCGPLFPLEEIFRTRNKLPLQTAIGLSRTLLAPRLRVEDLQWRTKVHRHDFQADSESSERSASGRDRVSVWMEQRKEKPI